MSEPVLMDPDKAVMGVVLVGGLLTAVVLFGLFALGVCG